MRVRVQTGTALGKHTARKFEDSLKLVLLCHLACEKRAEDIRVAKLARLVRRWRVVCRQAGRQAGRECGAAADGLLVPDARCHRLEATASWLRHRGACRMKTRSFRLPGRLELHGRPLGSPETIRTIQWNVFRHARQNGMVIPEVNEVCDRTVDGLARGVTVGAA